MLHTVNTYNEHSLNSASYRTVLLNPHDTTQASPVFLSETDADAMDAGIYNVDPQTHVLSIEVRSVANRHALISQLKTWFKRGTLGDLVVTFQDDGIAYLKPCRVLKLQQDPGYPNRFLAMLQTGATAWRAVDADTDTLTMTGSSGYLDIDVGGDDETRLIAELTAVTAPASGFFKQNLYQFVNVPGINFGYRPWCVVVDTAALVTAGKMQADCDDLRIFNGATEIKRWIDGPNTSSTKVWFNLSMKPGFSLTLKTAFASGDNPTWLEFLVDATHRTAIGAMDNEGVIYHGTEWIYYKGKNTRLCKLKVKKRGVWGTTKQSHSANDVFKFIQNPIRMVHSNPSATNPASSDSSYDSEKPMFNLNSSTNAKWVYDATTKFYDPANPARTGQWKLVNKKSVLSTVSKLYHVKQLAVSGDPAMGVKVGAFQVGSVWFPDTVEMGFVLECPAGFDKITTTGRKYRNKAVWMSVSGFQHSIDGVEWVELWNEATPSTVASWENWSSHSSVAITNTSKYLRLVVNGIFPKTTNAYAITEALTATAEFVSASMPSGSFLGEVNNYPLSLTMSVDLSEDEVDLAFPALYNKPFLLDGENYDVTFDDANAHRAITPNDSGREVWLRLMPGTNRITITGTDVGELDVDYSWYRRRL